MQDMTPATLELFTDLVLDADNWSGVPLWGGNVGGGKQLRGNLTDLKKRGLVVTDAEREGGQMLEWVYFTPAGKALADELGLKYGHLEVLDR